MPEVAGLCISRSVPPLSPKEQNSSTSFSRIANESLASVKSQLGDSCRSGGNAESRKSGKYGNDSTEKKEEREKGAQEAGEQRQEPDADKAVPPAPRL